MFIEVDIFSMSSDALYFLAGYLYACFIAWP